MGELQVTVVEGKNFDKRDLFSENDAFVELYLDNKKERTKVIPNSKTPQWNQTFVFNHLQGQDILHVDVYDKDLIKNDKIGSVHIDLRDLYRRGRIDTWYNLLGKRGSSAHGQLHLVLNYRSLQP